jgi:hypothetical protein
MAKTIAKTAATLPDDMPAPYTPGFTSTVLGVRDPFVDAAPMFCLVFHPLRWIVMRGRLIPSLQTFPLMAGVQGVSLDKDGNHRFAGARAKIEESGRRMVPFEWGPGGSYIQEIKTRPNGRGEPRNTYLSIFERALAGDTATSCDEDAYASWVASLVDTGKLPGCPPAVARRMREAVEQKLHREEALAEKGGNGAGAASIRARSHRVALEVLTAAIGDSVAVAGKATTPKLTE